MENSTSTNNNNNTLYLLPVHLPVTWLCPFLIIYYCLSFCCYCFMALQCVGRAILCVCGLNPTQGGCFYSFPYILSVVPIQNKPSHSHTYIHFCERFITCMYRCKLAVACDLYTSTAVTSIWSGESKNNKIMNEMWPPDSFEARRKFDLN